MNPELSVKNYKKIIKKLQKNREQLLILVPETLDCEFFSRRLGALPYHGKLPARAARENWLAFARGDAPVLVGTRIAAMIPAPRLSAIAIERPYDPSHRNSEAEPRYDARIIARSRLEMSFPQKRESRIPTTIIDLNAERRARNFTLITPDLENALAECIKKNKKAFLILNRKGLSAITACRACKYLFSCDKCSRPLTLFRQSMTCLHCLTISPVPMFCPKCKGPDIQHSRTGLQRVAADLKIKFSDAEIETISKIKTSDKPAPYPSRPRIVVTTSVALHWYRYNLWNDRAIGLVAILLADQLWGQPGYAANTEALQTLRPLGEIAARHKASFLIQTYDPDARPLLGLTDPARFEKEEMEDRKALNYPPFGHIVVLRPPHARGYTGGTPIVRKAKTIEEALQNIPKDWSIDLDPETIPT